jgi:phosphatidylglycerophosphatase A
MESPDLQAMSKTIPPPSPSPAAWTDPSVVVATVLWIGRIRPAPGTWGALAGVPLSLGTGWLATAIAAGIAGGPTANGWAPATLSLAIAIAVEAVVLAILGLAAVPICTRAARRLGLGKDPGAIVLDETASLPVGLLVVPFAERTWSVLLLGWLLHRVFDITKPFPCRRLERLPGGLGIMADDMAAAGWMAVGLLAVRALARAAGLG